MSVTALCAVLVPCPYQWKHEEKPLGFLLMRMLVKPMDRAIYEGFFFISQPLFVLPLGPR